MSTLDAFFRELKHGTINSFPEDVILNSGKITGQDSSEVLVMSPVP